MVFVIFARDKGRVMSTLMAFVTRVGTLSQHLSCASEVPEACTSDA
jgi:hypothetical protein